LECGNNQLTSLFLNNGNNHNMLTMISLDNPDLTCIQVDDKMATYPACGGFPLVGWCVDEWTFYSEKCNLGMTDLQSINLKLYPNPVADVLTISSPNTEILSIQLYTIEGKIIGSFEREQHAYNEIDLTNLDAGIYLLKLYLNGGQETKRIIKK
jgi:hypothetical protein